MFALLLLLLLPSCSLAAVSSTLAPWPSDFQARPNPGETVHTTGIMQVLEADPLTSDGNPTVLYVESDVPVVAERLTAGSSAFLEAPIVWGSAMVIVKSSGCPEGTSIEVDISNSTMENGKDYSLKISTTTTGTGDAVLDSSALFRQLQCFSQVEPPCEPPAPAPQEDSTVVAPTVAPAPAEGEKEGETTSQATARTTKASMLLSLFLIGFSTLFSGHSSRAKGTALVLSVAFGIGATICLMASFSSSTTPVVQASRELQECSVNVEVVYWGCTTVLNATAPSLVLRNLHQETTQDRENCNCTSLATFPDLDAPREEPEFQYLDFDANNEVATDGTTHQVPLADSSNCLLAIGRPFKDQEGSTVQAVPKLVEPEEAAWSKMDPKLWQHYNTQPPQTPLVTVGALLEDWIQRALGEHSSVASFAAFTIALQSNGAPPDLIHASLQAAQDEVRHAQISFQAATILNKSGGRAVEPKALPPSSHVFGANLMALAIGVLEEGCIDETMSALEMASNVDENKDDWYNLWLWNITRMIALEEGQHAVLAWRTLQWICQKDATICAQVLEEDRVMAVALRKYDSSSLTFQIWRGIACRASGWEDCPNTSKMLQTGSLMKQLVDEIIQSVAKFETEIA